MAMLGSPKIEGGMNDDTSVQFIGLPTPPPVIVKDNIPQDDSFVQKEDVTI